MVGEAQPGDPYPAGVIWKGCCGALFFFLHKKNTIKPTMKNTRAAPPIEMPAIAPAGSTGDDLAVGGVADAEDVLVIVAVTALLLTPVDVRFK